MGRPADPSPARLDSTTEDGTTPASQRPKSRGVSPELALVDPELARAERARLDERAELEAYKQPPPPTRPLSADEVQRIRHAVAAVEEEEAAGERAASARPRIALVAALFAALIAGGVAAAWFLAGNHGGASSAPGAPIAAPPAGPHQVKAAAVRTGHPSVVVTDPSGRRANGGGAPAVVVPSLPMLERRVLTLLAGAPTSKLPRQFIDVGTHAARTDLKATCQQTAARSFLCIVRSPRRPATEGLYIRYRALGNGKGVFAWLGYRG